MRQDSSDKTLLAKFMESQERCQSYIRDKMRADCDRDMQYNTTEFGVNLTKFYKWSGANISKLAFGDKCEPRLNEKEKKERLLAHDETFINRDPAFRCDMDRASKAVPNRTIDISEWDPDEGSKCLTEFISSRKKIDVFYKLHASLFEKPIYNVLKMITRAKYFPEKMRTSRATFIPGPRTIFSLEALA